MRSRTVASDSLRESLEYQDRILPAVSRTFALTIPQLPNTLRRVVTNAYLLCRIADTIEDESAMGVEQKQYFHDFFVRVVADADDPHRFAAELVPQLTNDALQAEKDLVVHLEQVIRVTRTFNPNQSRALKRCVRVMCEGMPRYERNASIGGLSDMRALDEYCYYVAGVVGETLTSLFCDYSDAIGQHCEAMKPLGVSFGQGLQMVNILKDFWEDHDRGVCWLPRDMFADQGIELRQVGCGCDEPGFARVYEQLISLAHGHLRRGFEYTLLIPERETGIRRFCLLSLALAVRTLGLIHQRPQFTSGDQVKVSHRSVANTLLMTRLLAGFDTALRRWFQRMARDLPMRGGGLGAYVVRRQVR